VFATYYFQGVSDANGHVDVPVRNPTWKSMQRSMTSSFGSNCYGSLLIAILQTINSALNSGRQQGRSSAIVLMILSCLSCIFGMIGNIFEYFNVTIAYSSGMRFHKSPFMEKTIALPQKTLGN
jgi:hypothetical protein